MQTFLYIANKTFSIFRHHFVYYIELGILLYKVFE